MKSNEQTDREVEGLQSPFILIFILRRHLKTQAAARMVSGCVAMPCQPPSSTVDFRPGRAWLY